MLTRLWHRFQLWRVKREIVRSLREAARLHVLTHDYAIANRFYDRIDEVKRSKPLPAARAMPPRAHKDSR